MGYDESSGVVAAAPTLQQAQDSYRAARQSFQIRHESYPIAPQPTPTPRKNATKPATQPQNFSGPKNVALEDIELVLDVENVSLKDVVRHITKQAEPYSGPWQVKWRLQPENAGLMDERVNLTAQAKFGEFVDLLTEKIKNLTGTQLFVTAFNSSRVLLVTDSYY
ncbi:MAG: hypothetical protein EBR79_02060 [Proteobacteria bacterium]|nr:hypothetical protein [Pseudomonadota bacterium]NBX86617.1 hypothetical protein [Pseudomonadota bacterium]